jgi:hypothetical protein
MTAKKQLQRFVMATGLTMMGLTSLFNSAAAQEPTPTPAPITTPVTNTPANANTPPTLLIAPASKHDDVIVAQLARIDKIIADHKNDDAFNAQRAPEIQDAIDAMIAALNAGANPDYFPGKDGLKAIRANTMSALQAAIVVGSEMNRPDLAIAFIEKSKDLRKKSPDDWSAMDYAVSGFLEAQTESVTNARSAALILLALHNKGVALSEAAAMFKVSEGKLKTYGDLARGLVGIEALHRISLINNAERDILVNGTPELKDTIRNATSITKDLIIQHGGKLMNYPESAPGDPEIYKIRSGDTLDSLAARFYRVMGQATPQDAAAILAITNDIINDATDMTAGKPLLVPVPLDKRIGTVTLSIEMSLVMLADRMKDMYHDQTLSRDDIARDLAQMNGIDPARIHEDAVLKKDQVMDVGLINNNHNQWPQLQAPISYKGEREVDLIVIEPADTHAKNTYTVANGTAYSINPSVDLTQIHSLSELLMTTQPNTESSETLRMLLAAEGSPVQDRVIFSHSMAIKIDEEKNSDKIRNKRGHDSAAYENIRLYLPQMERARPIIFNAAGNFWPEEGRYIQSYQMAHSPRSVLVGAVGQYPINSTMDEDRVIAPYSTHGADICAPLPMEMTRQMEGTSFATPLLAAVYRQMAEWYGDTLSFEEIMAASLMTADRNVLDYDKSNSALPPLLNPNPYATKPAEFRSNGGGLPHHERCGAGVINMTRWQAALDTMVALKTSPTMNGQGVGPAHAAETSYTLPVSAPQVILPKTKDGKAEYVYRVTAPADMTTGKLTLLLPQYEGSTSEIVLRTPGGFEKHMGKSIFGIVSTFAFAYEDIKAGSVFEIHSNKPLGPTAGIILRGHTPGNTIAMLRDHLRAQGILPAPNMEMSGDIVVGPNKPINVLQQKLPDPTPPKPASTPEGTDKFRPDDMPIRPVTMKKGPALSP